tara:strand:+ start:125 stop:427 length:303 start_codon:yes stop_codon:yes gene_type:complete
MKPVTKSPSSLNMTAAIDKNKVKHLGKNWATIDFEIKESVNASDFKYSKMKPIIGTFVIGNKRVDVTFSELNQIMHTAGAAMQQCENAYRMGKWGSAERR